MSTRKNWFDLVSSVIKQHKKTRKLKRQFNAAYSDICEGEAQSCPIDLNKQTRSCILEICQIDASGNMTLRVVARKFCDHFSVNRPCNQDCPYKDANNKYCSARAQYKMAHAKYKDLVHRTFKSKAK